MWGGLRALRSGRFNRGDIFWLTIPFWCLYFKQTRLKDRRKEEKNESCYLLYNSYRFLWHVFFSLPSLGCRNMSWLSFLAESVISARPQFGQTPRPTGDPCSCKNSRKWAVLEWDSSPEGLSGLSPSFCIINIPSPMRSRKSVLSRPAAAAIEKHCEEKNVNKGWWKK